MQLCCGATAGILHVALPQEPFNIKTWNKSKKTPRTFIVSDKLAPFVMGRAQALVSDWHEKNSAHSAMKIQTVTDGLIDTYNPTDLLQEYVKELATLPEPPASLPVKSKLRPEIDAMLTSIRTLLEAGQTEAALSQMETLKILLQKDVSPAKPVISLRKREKPFVLQSHRT